MTLFEYVSVMVSIVLALGVSHLLDAASRILRERSWRDMDPVFSIWFVVQIGIHFEVWWALWSFRDLAVWNYMSFIYVITGPILLVVNNGFLMPSREELCSVSLADHFQAVKSRVMGVWVLFLAWSLLFGPIVAGEMVRDISALIVLSGVVIVTLFSRSRRVQLWAGILAILFFSALILSTRFFGHEGDESVGESSVGQIGQFQDQSRFSGAPPSSGRFGSGFPEIPGLPSRIVDI